MMAFLYGDSFDLYATADIPKRWPGSILVDGAHTLTVGAGNGQKSSNAIRCSFTNANNVIYALRSMSPSGSTAIIGFAFKPTNYLFIGQPVRDHFLAILNGAGGAQCSLRLNSDYTISVCRDTAGGTVLATSSTTITPSAYTFLELKVTIGTGTSGSFELRFAGATVAIGAGVNTAAQGGTDWNGVRLGSSPGFQVNSLGGTCDYENFYACDGTGAVCNDFLGPIHIKATLPDSAGNYAQFTPSTGANWQNVDDVPQDGDGTYNAAVAAGLIDTYGFAAVGLAGTVKAVQLAPVVRSAAGGTETIAPVVRIAGVDYVGTSIVGLSTTYGNKLIVYANSPATAAPWTIAEIDAAEFGLKLVS